MTTTAAPNRLSQLRAAEAAAVAALGAATASVERLGTDALADALLGYERACAAYAARVRQALREAFGLAESTAAEVGALAGEIAAAFGPEEVPAPAPEVPAEVTTAPEPTPDPAAAEVPPWGTDGIDDADLGDITPGQRLSPEALKRMAEIGRATPPPAPTRRTGRRRPAKPAPAVPVPSTNGDH